MKEKTYYNGIIYLERFMKKRLTLILASLFLFVGMVMAQSRVTGTVVSADDGEPVIGASVKVAGTKTGTVTNVDGEFTLPNVKDGSKLIVSYIGMQPKMVKASQGIKIVLSPDDKVLDEVVVTAQGLARQKRSLGYATTEIKAKDLSHVNEGSLNNALVGKVAGARFVGGSGAKFDEGAIVLRGVTSITDDAGTNPIYVVDGVITSASAVNMADVASVNVLKGPAATALYGVRGGNGAVVIVTKSGKLGADHQEVNISHSTTWSKAYSHAKLQKEYGGGQYGADGELDVYEWQAGDPESYKQFNGRKYYDYADDVSWGPKFDPTVKYMPAIAWDETSPYFGLEDTWTNHLDLDDLFDTGVTNTTNVSFEKTGKDYLAHVALSNSNIGGVNPNSDAQRRYASAKLAFSPLKNFKVTFDYKYTYKKNHNAATEGYGTDAANPYSDLLQWGNTNVNLKQYRDYRRTDGSIRTWNIVSPTDFTAAFHDSPYATYDEINKVNVREYHVIAADFEYSLPYNIKLGWKTTGNLANYKETDNNSALTGITSAHDQFMEKSADIYNQARVTWADSFFDRKLALDAALFFENRYYHYDGQHVFTRDGLLMPGLYNTGNSKGLSGGDDSALTGTAYRDAYNRKTGIEKQKTQSVFGTFSAGWDDTYYLELSLRNDWNSTLPTHDNSYLYGGASVSAIASNWFKHGSWLNYWKIRASVAQVGSALKPYELSSVYNFSTRYGSTATIYEDPVLIDKNIKPTITSSYEVGTEFSLFNNRLWGDINFYRRDTKNQIIKVSTSASSGYSSNLTNAGLIRNSGYEISLGGKPVKTKDFEWEINANIAHNVNKLVRLAEGMNRYNLDGMSFYDYLYSYAEVGKAMGALYTSRVWNVNDEGKKILRQKADGSYVPTINSSKETYLGNLQPKFTGGFSTQFTYKGVTLSTAIDYRIGGKLASVTNMWLEGSGLGKNTVGKNDKGHDIRESVANGGGVRIDGVVANGTDANGKTIYKDVTAYVDAQTYFSNYACTLWEPYVEDGTYVKMRELSLGYAFPKSLLSRLHIGLNAASVSFIANNPFLIYSKMKNIDPSESDGTAFEQGQAVSTRSFGFSVNLTF